MIFDSAHFLLVPTRWLGQGTIDLNMVQETLSFATKWTISSLNEMNQIVALQEIEIRHFPDKIVNEFVFFDITSSDFKVLMDSPSLGRAEAKGFLREGEIGWEFSKQNGDFEGFEYYKKTASDVYEMKAHYKNDGLHTHIKGKIWLPLKK
ncbi:MAG: hypothetical protein ACOVOR_01315 [Rhabdochlamydiaceae bacterium]